MVKIGTIDVTYHKSIWNKYIGMFRSSKVITDKKKQERHPSLLFAHEDTSILIGCISNDDSPSNDDLSYGQLIPSHLSLNYLFEVVKNETEQCILQS